MSVIEWVQHAKRCDVPPRACFIRRHQVRAVLQEIMWCCAGEDQRPRILKTLHHIERGHIRQCSLGTVYGFELEYRA